MPLDWYIGLFIFVHFSVWLPHVVGIGLTGEVLQSTSVYDYGFDRLRLPCASLERRREKGVCRAEPSP